MNASKNQIYEAEILKLKHERDTAEEVMKALHNAKHSKMQISKLQQNTNQFHDR